MFEICDMCIHHTNTHKCETSLNYTLHIQGSLGEPTKNSNNLDILCNNSVCVVMPINYIAAYLQSDCGF